MPKIDRISEELAIPADRLRLVLQVIREGRLPHEPLEVWEAYALIVFAFLSRFVPDSSTLAGVLVLLKPNLQSMEPWAADSRFHFTPVLLTNGTVLEMGGGTGGGKNTGRQIFDVTTGTKAPQEVLDEPMIWSVIFNPQSAYERICSSEHHPGFLAARDLAVRATTAAAAEETT